MARYLRLAKDLNEFGQIIGKRGAFGVEDKDVQGDAVLAYNCLLWSRSSRRTSTVSRTLRP